jgi:hypothetical protein
MHLRAWLVRLAALTVGAGFIACSSPLYLKKYATVVPKTPTNLLAGKSIFVAPFGNENRVDDSWEQSERLEDPPGFEYSELNDAEWDQWEKERDQLQATTPEGSWHKVGWQRNLFGMPIRDIHSVNDPAEWMTSAAQAELQAQGATLAQSPDGADVVVHGTLKWLRIDLYMATWCDMVIDLNIEPQGATPLASRIHTAGAKTAWSGSDEETWEMLRQCEQKFDHYLVSEIERALGGSVAAPAVGTPTG